MKKSQNWGDHFKSYFKGNKDVKLQINTIIDHLIYQFFSL